MRTLLRKMADESAARTERLRLTVREELRFARTPRVLAARLAAWSEDFG